MKHIRSPIGEMMEFITRNTLNIWLNEDKIDYRDIDCIQEQLYAEWMGWDE